MADHLSDDPLESPSASRQPYKTSELAKELGSSEEQVKTWIRKGDIRAISNKDHAEYHADTIEQLRALQNSG